MKMRAAVLRESGLPRPYSSSRPLSIEEVDLDLVFEPPWDKSMMSEAAKLELNL